MIQDIFPHAFDNSFSPRKPLVGDRVLIYRDDAVLICCDEEAGPQLPTFGELIKYWSDIEKHATYLFAIDIEGFFLVDESEVNIRLPKKYMLENVSLFRTMKPQYLAFAGITGHQLYKWYTDNKYCGRCGSIMENGTTERSRVCPDCGMTVYPHISPAIIVAVTDGKRLLMARSKTSSYKRYGLIAGFVEFGESFEDTVKRELQEEVGICVKNLRYFKSQPWAFSGDEMVGFLAELDGDDTLTVDENELTEAKWFSRDDIPVSESNISIAQELIETVRSQIGKDGE